MAKNFTISGSEMYNILFKYVTNNSDPTSKSIRPFLKTIASHQRLENVHLSVVNRDITSDEANKYIWKHNRSNYVFLYKKLKTLCVNLDTGKTASAYCHPDDHLDSAIGRAVSLCRLLNGKDCDYISIIRGE